MSVAGVSMTFFDHLGELRRRVILCLVFAGIGAVMGYLTYPSAVQLFIAPFAEVEGGLQTFAIHEGFLARMTYGVILGLVYSLPFTLGQMIAFLIPAMTPGEKRVMGVVLSVGTLLFVGGFYYAYAAVLPGCIELLQDPAFLPEGVKQTLNFSRNLAFVLQILLAFGVVFQVPLILFTLMWFKLLKRTRLLGFSRYFIVLAFILAAVLTPPDPLSQAMLAIPLILLYFLSIFMAKCFGIGE